MLTPQIYTLVGVIVGGLVLMIIVKMFIINNLETPGERERGRGWVNRIYWTAVLLAIVNLAVAGVSISTKEIPRTGFDRGDVIEDATNN